MYRLTEPTHNGSSSQLRLWVAIVTIAGCFGAALSARAQYPSVIFSQANGVGGVFGSPGYNPASPTTGQYGGTVAHLAANNRGDVFANVNGGGSYVDEIPVNGGVQVSLITGEGSPYGGNGVAVDKSGNVYVADTADAQVLFIPFVNGGYPPTTAHSSLGNCTFPVPANQNTDCIVNISYPSSIGYYGQAGDLGLDAAGDLFVLFKYTGGGSQYPGADVLMEYAAATGNPTVITGTLQNDASGEIAVNAAGDVFVMTYGSISEYPHNNYATALPVYSLNGPTGISTDASGNLFITNTSGGNILECPYANGTYGMPTSCPIVSNQLATGYSPSPPTNGLAIDGYGRITMAGNYPNSVSSLTVGHLTFGATPVNTTSGSVSINAVFSAAKTLGSMKVSGPFNITSNGCAAGSFAAGGNCSIALTYSSSEVGTQLGQLTAFDSNGNILGSAVLSGQGTGPTLNADPGTDTADGIEWIAPAAVATDNAGNIYVADSSTGNIYKTTTASTVAGTVVASGFNAPTAVAVDGAGNLYVADTGNTQIVEVPYNASTSTYGNHGVILTGLNGPSGLAVDLYGDLYVADSGNARVLRLASSGDLGVGTLVTRVGSGFNKPVAVAVDNTNNNLYVSDAGAGTVVQFNTVTSSQSSVLTGLSVAAGVAVDPAGSVFVVDSGKSTITRLPFISGGLNPNFETTLATVVKLPTAIATDNSGNLYVADTTDAIVETDLRSTGILSLGNLTVGQTSGVVAGQLSNSGTASLTFASPYYTQSGPNASSFTVKSSSLCANSLTLGTGASCTVAATFTPQSYGILTDELVLATSSPVNASAATLTLSGTGTPVLITTTVTLAVTSSGSPTFGQPVTITATVTPASQATATPTGTVTFYVDSVAQQPVTLNNATGKASVTLTGLTGGSHTITASYSGDYFYSYSSSSSLPLTVGLSSTSTTVTVVAPDTNPTAANQAQAVTLIAYVIPPIAGTPTNTVTFYNGTTALGTAPVTPYTAQGFNEGSATLVINSTVATELSLGQYEITATYNGDTNYSKSTSATAVPLLIANPSISLSPSASSVVGGTGSINIVVASVAGFNGAVDFSCAGLPAYSTCSFSPAYASVSAGAPVTIGFTVATNQPPVIAVPSGIGFVPNLPGNRLLAGLVALCLLLPALLFGRARRMNGHLLGRFSATRCLSIAGLLLLSLCGIGLSGCGSSTGVFTTPAGTFTITVSGTITTGTANPPAAASIPVQLIVQ